MPEPTESLSVTGSAPELEQDGVSLITELINSEMKNISEFGDGKDEPSPGPDPSGPAEGQGQGGLIGLQSLEQSLGEGRHPHQPPGGTLPPLDMSQQSNQPPGHKSARIEELMDTLECPVCLDTADTAPVYQCPEGHLICKDCNGKMVECPQCGHALMNARNRTAELLAVKLAQLRGDSVKSVMASQALNISVTHPQKVGRGLFSFITYRVYTCIGLDKMAKNEFTVYRRYRDFLKLHEKLEDRYAAQCIILPPPPSNSKVKSVSAKVRTDSETDGLGRSIGWSGWEGSSGLRCRDLDRYLKRLAKHPSVRKDPDFRLFLQESKLSENFGVKKSLGQRITATIDRWNNKTNKFTTTDTDSWFKTRELQHEDLKKQMETLQKDIVSMKQQKMTLFVSTTAFRRNLLDLLGNNSHGGREKTAKRNRVASAAVEPGESRLEKAEETNSSSTSVLNRVAEFQNVMADLYLQQAEADEMLYFLAMDYRRILGSVDQALARRRRALKELQKQLKKSGSEKGEIDTEKMDSAQSNFDKLNQNMRRELEHFDTVMREEFGETFDRYHKQYRTALSLTNTTSKSSS